MGRATDLLLVDVLITRDIQDDTTEYLKFKNMTLSEAIGLIKMAFDNDYDVLLRESAGASEQNGRHKDC